MRKASEIKDLILTGDCIDLLQMEFEKDVFDLIITSPPYANARKKTYESIHPDRYVEWFLPKSKEFFRVLKPEGTFILNIKERVVDGERHTYVIDLIKAMKRQGWYWTEEYIWKKKNCYPGKWPNRFRDAWERCLQFNKSKKFKMYQEAVMVPMGDWADSRLKNLSDRDRTRYDSQVGSGFGKNIENWKGRELSYPTNVLEFPTECANVGHPAAFPITIPEWFIKLFTTENDVVLDPFSGSGATGVAAKKMKRRFVMIDIERKYRDVAWGRVYG